MNKLAGAAVVTLLLLAIPTQETRETREKTQETSTPQETSTKTQERYGEVTAWCNARFPFRDDLQEACKWGAYEMLPGQDVPVLPEEGTQDA